MDVSPATDFEFTFSSHNDANCYSSAPSSPTRLTEMYCGFDELLIAANANYRNSSVATIPFAWEEKPGVPKTHTNLFEDDFSFDVCCDLDSDQLSAPADQNLFKTHIQERERGRERGFSTSTRLPASSRSRRTRSLSPLGSSDQRRKQMVLPSSIPPSTDHDKGSRRWSSFLDVLLFRSASDGRAMDKDPLKKYSAANFNRKYDQDMRNSSGSMSKRRGRVSAHELHYNVNRAVSNDMKRKTYLPYKQGILGR